MSNLAALGVVVQVMRFASVHMNNFAHDYYNFINCPYVQDADSTSDGRSSRLTNCTLTSRSSRNHSHSSPDLMHSREGGAHYCSEEHQQHCSQEAASNASQETTSAVDSLSAAIVSRPHTVGLSVHCTLQNSLTSIFTG